MILWWKGSGVWFSVLKQGLNKFMDNNYAQIIAADAKKTRSATVCQNGLLNDRTSRLFRLCGISCRRTTGICGQAEISGWFQWVNLRRASEARTGSLRDWSITITRA